jgi:ubiquitin-protein ligase
MFSDVPPASHVEHRAEAKVFEADLSELSLGSTMRTKFPNPDDILNFTLTIEPDEGLYKSGSFHFTFAINQNFPHDPPKVKCTQKIYHPNIDLEGNVCLNILREDWKPVLNLNAIIVGLQVCRRGTITSGNERDSFRFSCESRSGEEREVANERVRSSFCS